MTSLILFSSLLVRELNKGLIKNNTMLIQFGANGSK